MAQLLRKISTKTVYGSKVEIQKLVFSDETKQHPLYRVAGYCTATRTGQTDEDRLGDDRPKKDARRDWVCLIGEFQAVNAATGEVFSSGQCFLPDYLTATIIGKLAGDVSKVWFAFDVFAQFDKDSATSYIYLAQPVQEAEAKDEVADYMKGLKALPAPAPATDATATAGGATAETAENKAPAKHGKK